MDRLNARSRSSRLVLGALLLSVGVMVIFPPSPQAGPTDAACTTQPGRTLIANRHVRLLSADDAAGNRTVYVCGKPNGRNWSLGSKGAIVRRPFDVSKAWAVASAEGGRPQDLFIRDVVARGAFSGRRNSCQIGTANRPGQLLRVDVVVVTDDGRIGWSGEERIGYGEPVVGTCIDGSGEVIARGADLETASLELKGQVLTWKEAGSSRSARL